jgi:hypothetical protein
MIRMMMTMERPRKRLQMNRDHSQFRIRRQKCPRKVLIRLTTLPLP